MAGFGELSPNLKWSCNQGSTRHPLTCSLSGRERKQMLGTAHSESGVTSSELKHHPRGSEVVRVSLLDDAFRDEASSWLLACLAVELGHLQVLPDFDLFRTGLSRASQNTHNIVSSGFPEPADPDLWSWTQFCWKKPAHFSELKKESFSYSLWWRLRCKDDLCAEPLRKLQVDASPHVLTIRIFG